MKIKVKASKCAAMPQRGARSKRRTHAHTHTRTRGECESFSCQPRVAAKYFGLIGLPILFSGPKVVYSNAKAFALGHSQPQRKNG